MVLVGAPNNEYIVDLLRVRINPFDLVYIPEKYIPSVKVNQVYLEPVYSEENFDKSGYGLQTTIYLLVILLI